MAGPDFGAGVSTTDVSHGNWSGLRCKVEEGFGRASKVLEDGTIQVNSLPLGAMFPTSTTSTCTLPEVQSIIVDFFFRGGAERYPP